MKTTPFKSLVPVYDDFLPDPANLLTKLYAEDKILTVVSHIGLNPYEKEYPDSKYILKVQIPVDDGFQYRLIASDKTIDCQIEDGKPLIDCVIYRESTGVLSYNPDHELATKWKEFRRMYEPC